MFLHTHTHTPFLSAMVACVTSVSENNCDGSLWPAATVIRIALCSAREVAQTDVLCAGYKLDLTWKKNDGLLLETFVTSQVRFLAPRCSLLPAISVRALCRVTHMVGFASACSCPRTASYSVPKSPSRSGCLSRPKHSCLSASVRRLCCRSRAWICFSTGNMPLPRTHASTHSLHLPLFAGVCSDT